MISVGAQALHRRGCLRETTRQITGDNFRLRLRSQVERILALNRLPVATTDLVEAARESLVIGTA